MTSNEVRKLFRAFFESKGHAWIHSSSLVPKNDPSVLFTTAGMHPLVPYLLGEPHPDGRRLANIQRCLRTDDIDEVGDEAHLTFFEMLGNWSLGDYFKSDSIHWSWEFLTDQKWLGLDPRNLAVSVFAGDQDAPFDTEATELWLRQPQFFGKERIARLGKKDNWWPSGGGTGGPCGPDTEIFYWMGKEQAPQHFDPTDKQWIEIWNNVFMQYLRLPNGSYETLKQQNVDTGMGFERIAMVVQQKNTIYETDLFQPMIDAMRRITHGVNHRTERIIVDHLRAVVFMAMDGVVPSNKDQGYIMRRLIRRSLIKWRQLGMHEQLAASMVPVVISQYSTAYPDLKEHQESIISIVSGEEQKFSRTVNEGLKMIHKFAAHSTSSKVGGDIMFQLFTSYGIPPELQPELFQEQLTGAEFDRAEFDRLFIEHQQVSRRGAGQKFKGGLANTSDRVVRMHTATHLLHEALRRVLGEHVEQRGSNITEQRLRFDFVQATKMSEKQIKDTERLVNDIIKEDLPVQREVLSKEQAIRSGARAIFGEKYGDQVSVYSIGPDEAGNYFSREFCGGPHVSHTGEIEHFQIVKEEPVSSGIRRIKASVA